MIRMVGALLLLPLFAAARPSAGKLFDPPRVDDSPTAYACSAQSLAAGEDCVFEGKAGARASAAANASRLTALAEPTCAAALSTASPADASALRAGCVARMTAAARACAVDGALVDGEGRFTEAARTCYHALFVARTQAVSLANAAPTCCQCLAEHRCAGAGSSCVAQAARGTVSARCAPDDVCLAACTELLQSAPSPKVSGRAARTK